MLSDSFSMKCSEWQIHRDRKVDYSLPEVGGKGKWKVTTKGYGFSFWGDEMFWDQTVVMAVKSCEYIRNHLTGRFKWRTLWYVKQIFKKKKWLKKHLSMLLLPMQELYPKTRQHITQFTFQIQSWIQTR